VASVLAITIPTRTPTNVSGKTPSDRHPPLPDEIGVEQTGPARDTPLVLESLTSRPPAETLPLMAEALTQRFPCRLFTRDQRLVEVDPQGRSHPVSLDRASALVQQAVTIRTEMKDGEIRYRPVPKDFVRWLRASPDAHFPPLRGVRRLPFLTAERSIARTNGYYPTQEIRLDLAGDGDAETGEQILRALTERSGASTPAALLGVLALLVECIARPAIDGPAPCYLVSCPNAAVARLAARELAAYALGRRPLDRGLPAREESLAADVAAALAVDGTVLLLERLSPEWSLSAGDLGRLLNSRGPVLIRRPGGRATADAGLTTCIAWGAPRHRRRLAEVVPIEIDLYDYKPGWFAGLTKSRLHVAAAITASVLSPREAIDPTSQPRVPRWDEWSRVVGGILATLAPHLGIADSAEVDRWLRDLALRDRTAVNPWARLLSRWPETEEGTAEPLTATEVVVLMDRVGAEGLVRWLPGRSDHSRVTALGLVLKRRAETGEPGAGLKLSRHKGRNGWTYFPVPVEARASA
jgi:hypothetical protein